MSIGNLHGLVRGAITTVNPDITAIYLKSQGNTVSGAGKPTAAFQYVGNVRVQIQNPNARDLQHIEALNLQGVIRTVFMFGRPQGVVRVDQLGGDMLVFPQYKAAPQPDFWLITGVPEGFDDGFSSWSKLYVTLQLDRNFTLLNSEGGPLLDSQGHMLRTK